MLVSDVQLHSTQPWPVGTAGCMECCLGAQWHRESPDVLMIFFLFHVFQSLVRSGSVERSHPSSVPLRAGPSAAPVRVS